MNKKLPDFKTPEEFAEFVENHDMGDYWEEFEDVDVTIKRPPKQKITMWIYPRLFQDVKKIAVQYGIPYQTLLQQWIAEKVTEEKKMLKKEWWILSPLDLGREIGMKFPPI